MQRAFWFLRVTDVNGCAVLRWWQLPPDFELLRQRQVSIGFRAIDFARWRLEIIVIILAIMFDI
ncbi:hypothetical protein BMW22_16275 [Rhizobium leguminosarum]|uniref:Uncharacterized protein n=1 Tax=Rhizobium leguminosarum TaxID=384 RepID=A0A1L3ZB99_RHILE|nr:hypothetical protein BMW22_16275 [Rhizobium leguminosarum]